MRRRGWWRVGGRSLPLGPFRSLRLITGGLSNGGRDGPGTSAQNSSPHGYSENIITGKALPSEMEKTDSNVNLLSATHQLRGLASRHSLTRLRVPGHFRVAALARGKHTGAW